MVVTESPACSASVRSSLAARKRAAVQVDEPNQPRKQRIMAQRHRPSSPSTRRPPGAQHTGHLTHGPGRVRDEAENRDCDDDIEAGKNHELTRDAQFVMELRTAAPTNCRGEQRLTDGAGGSLHKHALASLPGFTVGPTGFGQIVEEITKGRVGAGDVCHEDPMFSNGRWAFGQTGAAQTHLATNGVGIGDVFLFFGLFASRDGSDRHHRIFGYMQVDEVRRLGGRPSENDNPIGFPRRHPHAIGEREQNNTLYLGSGARARTAPLSLRLSKPGIRVSIWSVPKWLKAAE